MRHQQKRDSKNATLGQPISTADLDAVSGGTRTSTVVMTGGVRHNKCRDHNQSSFRILLRFCSLLELVFDQATVLRCRFFCAHLKDAASDDLLRLCLCPMLPTDRCLSLEAIAITFTSVLEYRPPGRNCGMCRLIQIR